MHKRILVVEDDPDIVRGLENCLREWGFDVESARDGVEAIEVLERDSRLTGMTLGLMMPRMNGIEVLRRLRQTNESLPVVIISAGFDHLNESEFKFLALHSQACLCKPYGRDALKEIVDRWFRMLPSDVTLRALVISQLELRDFEAARQAACQISDRGLQRWAWIRILYIQYFDSKDLTGIKTTLALISDSSLWYGSWFDGFLHDLVQTRDSAGAIEAVSRIKDPIIRGVYFATIARAQALDNDLEGVERTLSRLSEDPDRMLPGEIGVGMLDMALGSVACSLAWSGGDKERARQYASRIPLENERNRVLMQIEQPPPWPKSPSSSSELSS